MSASRDGSRRAAWLAALYCAAHCRTPAALSRTGRCFGMHATGARAMPGFNGNRVQSPGCPRNGKQRKPLQGALQRKGRPLMSHVARRARDGIGKATRRLPAICQPGYRPVGRRVACARRACPAALQRPSAGSSVAATGLAAGPWRCPVPQHGSASRRQAADSMGHLELLHLSAIPLAMPRTMVPADGSGSRVGCPARGSGCARGRMP